ncbi:MAG: hypothetical protein JO287_23585 [Pseudonocardiales bacterium]|nr:hypothetical protein [Pseudonocardiales bacterium]
MTIFCGFFWACELVNDVPRADQWMRAAAELIQRRNVVAAFCRAHYGGILTEAEAQLIESTRHFDRGMPERRAASLIRLADLRLRQGHLGQAALLPEGLDTHPDAVRALAGLYLARDLLERCTAGFGRRCSHRWRNDHGWPFARAARRCPSPRGRPRRR